MSIYKFSQGCALTVTYERIESKKWYIYKGKEAISLAQIWINNISALHLKKLQSSTLPKDNQEFQHLEKENHYYFDFKNDWSWLEIEYFSSRLEIREVDVRFHFNNTTYALKLWCCLNVLGLKKRIEDFTDPKEAQNYLLYHNALPLAANRGIYTLCNADDVIDIDVLHSTDLSGGPTSLQMATGGQYVSVIEFENYVNQMKEKIDIVCQIKMKSSRNLGTGFLISQHLIMTNHHVVQDNTLGGTAQFYYHDTQAKKRIDIDIEPENVCFSPSPGNNCALKKDHLDYAIVRLEPAKNLTKEQLEDFERLGKIAKDFFQKAQNEFFRKKRRPTKVSLQTQVAWIEEERERCQPANIIQHPALKGEKPNEYYPQPKKVAFRDNRVFAFDDMIFHYKSKTGVGSSGSPVINDQGQWIGLHYSECIEITKFLFKHIVTLCTQLGYTYNAEDTSSKAYAFRKGENNLYVFRSGMYKMMYSEEKGEGTDKFTLRDLIKKNYKGAAFYNFILTFLADKNANANQKKHIYCNNALHVDNIFADLEKGKIEQIQEAINACDRKWKVAAETLGICSCINLGFKIAEVAAVKFLAAVLFILKKDNTESRNQLEGRIRREYGTYVNFSLLLSALIGVAFTFRKAFIEPLSPKGERFLLQCSLQ